MKAYYDSKGLDTPYKSLGAFRRARRAQAQSYRDNRKEWSQTFKENANTQKPVKKNVETNNDVNEQTHIFIANNLGKAGNAIKARFDIKSSSVIITDKQFASHIAKGANAHDDIYEKVKDDIANIIQDPDFIFISDKRENSVIFVSISHKAQFIVKLNVESKQKANTIITIFGCGEKTLKRLKKKNEILYKKGIDKIEK